jgi:signal transduction histidine kinase
VNATTPTAVPVHRFAHGGDGDRRRALWPAAALALFEVVGTIGASQGQPEARDLDVLAFVLVLAAPIALVWRRTRPEVALGVAFASVIAYLALDYPKGPIFIGLILSYVNAVVAGWRRLAVATLVTGYVIVAWVMPAFDDGPWPDWALVGGLAAWLLVLASASELIRSRIEQRRALIQRAVERDAARAEEARRRASEERLRIARELHDVLAHNISLINVRAGVALHLVDERPDGVDADQVRPALAAIKDASKEALGELRSVLDLLRQGEAAPLAPTAGLADLDRLVDGARGTGLDVRVERIDGEGRAVAHADIARGLPAGVDLAAYRIAQEALTNVVRHAHATQVTVRLRRTPDELEVQVDDDGVGTTAPLGPPDGDRADGAPGADGADRSDGGRGLAGMRERALALGGTADAGPRPGRGFRVRARFPVTGGGA